MKIHVLILVCGMTLVTRASKKAKQYVKEEVIGYKLTPLDKTYTKHTQCAEATNCRVFHWYFDSASKTCYLGKPTNLLGPPITVFTPRQKSIIMLSLGGRFGAARKAEVITIPPNSNICGTPLPNLPIPINGGFGGLINGKIIACLGNDRTCYKYSPCSKSWLALENYLDRSRRAPGHAVMGNETFWLLGGLRDDANDTPLNSTVKIHIDGTTIPGPDIPFNTPISGSCVVKINNTHLMLTQGTDAAILDTVTSNWHILPDLLFWRIQHACGKAGDDQILIIGGIWPLGVRSWANTQIFSLTSQSWREGPPVPNETRLYKQATIEYKGRLLLSGVGIAYSGGKLLYEYNPIDEEWKLLSEELPISNTGHIGLKIPESVLVCNE